LHIHQNFARLPEQFFTFYLGIDSIWKQSRLDDCPDVVVSLFIPNLQYIEIIPKKIGAVKTFSAALSETDHAKQTRPPVHNVGNVVLDCEIKSRLI
jgi:hypothetical protein